MGNSLADELIRISKGEVLSDDWTRKIYSVDASHLKETPQAIAYPKDSHDIQELCRFCFSKEIPIAGRGAGTGLLGQCLSDGVIIDFTRHMNKIVEIDSDFVIVQPGIVKGILDAELKKQGKFLPPDPASSNFCTIGGMIANNSSGAHALGFGNTIDFINGIEFVVADGSTGQAAANPKDNFMQQKIRGEDQRISKLYNLVLSNWELIVNRFPKVSKNSCGYRVDALFKDSEFLPHKIFAASEGTLGFVTLAKMRILDIPTYRTIMVLGFENVLDAVSTVEIILNFNPDAIEMIDHTIIKQIDANPTNLHATGSLLFIEFSGNKYSDVEKKISECKHRLTGRYKMVETAFDTSSIDKIWNARKSALNQIMKLSVGSRKPIGLIEDTVVQPSLLSQHTRHILDVYSENELDYVMYGHVGNGNIHTRPVIDIQSPSQVRLIDSIADDIFGRVISNGGTITGEHGDGISRSKYIPSMYGQNIYALFKNVKKLFDPKSIMNPGKKILPT